MRLDRRYLRSIIYYIIGAKCYRIKKERLERLEILPQKKYCIFRRIVYEPQATKIQKCLYTKISKSLYIGKFLKYPGEQTPLYRQNTWVHLYKIFKEASIEISF